jgi:hypothetical protein
MSASSNPTHTDRGEPDLRLPDHRQEMRTLPAPLRVVGAAAGAVGAAIIALVYLIGAPLIAFVTGAGEILMEVRDNAVRPRPFVGARHGFPFLDPPPPAPAQPVEANDTEH